MSICKVLFFTVIISPCFLLIGMQEQPKSRVSNACEDLPLPHSSRTQSQKLEKEKPRRSYHVPPLPEDDAKKQTHTRN